MIDVGEMADIDGLVQDYNISICKRTGNTAILH